jgi:hypothetical protein
MTAESWKARANKRRDARATKTPDTAAPHRSSKNTKKWCKGKVGVEHKPKCVDYADAKIAAKDINGRPIGFYKGWKLLICTTCGKELEHYYPFRQSEKKPPEWVK